MIRVDYGIVGRGERALQAPGHGEIREVPGVPERRMSRVHGTAGNLDAAVGPDRGLREPDQTVHIEVGIEDQARAGIGRRCGDEQDFVPRL